MNKNRDIQTNGEAELTRARPLFTPRADIFETADAFHLTADMPGVGADALDVTLNDGVLTISGVYELSQPEGYSSAYAEFAGGEYRRSFRLSDATDASKIKATMRDGVLRLSVPKAKPASAKIPVTAG